MTILEHSQPPLSAGDSGYRRIRSDIIFGVLTPSGRLRLESMKEDYGVSVSTLREILSRLASDGFVVAEGRRGFEVTPVSAKDLKLDPADTAWYMHFGHDDTVEFGKRYAAKLIEVLKL